jgi:hypothetical protein
MLTRRYEIRWLDETGAVSSTTRLAPAMRAFEDACSAFARGTLLDTECGPVAIEDLEPGARLRTAEGGLATLVWIGAMTVYPAGTVPGVGPVSLTRVHADSFGAQRPAADVLLGPGARVLLRGARCEAVAGVPAGYVAAGSLCDGETACPVSPVAPITVYHVMLDRHATVRAGGLDVAAFHPAAALATLDPQIALLFRSLFPQLRDWEACGALAHPDLDLQGESELAA